MEWQRARVSGADGFIWSDLPQKLLRMAANVTPCYIYTSRKEHSAGSNRAAQGMRSTRRRRSLLHVFYQHHSIAGVYSRMLA